MLSAQVVVFATVIYWTAFQRSASTTVTCAALNFPEADLGLLGSTLYVAMTSPLRRLVRADQRLSRSQGGA